MVPGSRGLSEAAVLFLRESALREEWVTRKGVPPHKGSLWPVLGLVVCVQAG